MSTGNNKEDSGQTERIRQAQPDQPQERDHDHETHFIKTAGIGGAARSPPRPSSSHRAGEDQVALQTYAGGALGEHVTKPAIDYFNKIANGEMEIELFYADQIVPTGELFQALQRGTIDAVHSDDDSMASPTPKSPVRRLFPVRHRYSLDVPVLFNQYGLADIWREEYEKVGVKHISAAGGSVQLQHQEGDQQSGRSEGLKLYTFPTAGRFLAQFGVVPVTLPYEDIEVAVQTGELDGMAWSGITEDYTVGWADVTNYFLTNNISGAWIGHWFANRSAGPKCPTI
jgi:TRAP-type mannitol/chloroaromatic compound transport system substrate-binding protein